MWPFSPGRKRLLADSALLGRWGQGLCERFLKRHGHRIIAKNFACRTGEIDIITASPDGAVVFIEVKTRADESFAAAGSAVTIGKKKKLIRAANNFVERNRLRDLPLRFDVMTVVLNDNGQATIRHYENAFTPYSI